MESFFNIVIQLYKNGNKGLIDAIDTFEKVEKIDKSNSFNKTAYSLYPKMTTINKFLTNDGVWKAVVDALQLSTAMTFPDFGETLIYGVVSNAIHNPEFPQVIVSNKADNTLKEFVQVLAVILKKRYTEFDEEMSALAEETEGYSSF